MNKKKKGAKRMWAVIAIATLLVLIVGYFYMPFSPLKSDFNKAVLVQMFNTKISAELFTSEEIESLPNPVKKYFQTCGYIGTPKMALMKGVYKNVDFLLSKDKPYTKIEYIEYFFVKEPVHLAFVDTTMFGIPFQGFDSYIDGIGEMKGVIAKTFTLFNQAGSEMDISCLVTVLSACLLVPNIALQDYISWESIDDTHAKATITYYGISASGIFSFTENGEMISFTTNDRWETQTDGTATQIPWSIIFGEYINKSGIKQPTYIKVAWHYENVDSVYFNSNNATIEYQ